MKRAPGGNSSEPLGFTVLYDQGGALQMNQLDTRHTHYVMERGGRIVHRSRSGDDRSFIPVIDQLLGR